MEEVEQADLRKDGLPPASYNLDNAALGFSPMLESGLLPFSRL
jgi:hypothetical protein